MNSSIVRVVMGYVLKMEALLLLLPCVVAFIYGESDWFSFIISAIVCLFFGILLSIKECKDKVFYLKEGCVATAISWILICVFGALPFVISGAIPNFIDALFETVSGYTTTGASILTNVEALSHSMLFWRSFLHWFGGMGVLVFLLAIVPMTGGSSMNLMKAESPGPTVGKFVPKIKTTAALLYYIYFGLSLLQFIILLIAKMPVFDALTTTFGTAGTGGFGIKADSIGGYSPAIQWIVAVFMMLFGINFNFYYFIILGKITKSLKMEEVRVYILIMLTAAACIFINTFGMYSTVEEGLRQAYFQVSSVMTSTGFATTDFNLWPNFSRGLMILVMFIGACAGSTGGGIKVSRIIICFKAIKNELHSYVHPKSVKVLKMDGETVDKATIKSTLVYLATFCAIYIISFFIVSLDGFDLETSFTSIVATFNNIGPGLSMVGPTGSFADFSILSKLVLIFDMLAGRLELFPLLLLFHPTIWSDLFKRKFRGTKVRKKLNFGKLISRRKANNK